jgi:hypothetical protein
LQAFRQGEERDLLRSEANSSKTRLLPNPRREEIVTYSVFEVIRGLTNGQTDGPTNGPTNQHSEL